MQVYAYRFLGDWQNTEDMVMDAFAIAGEKIDIFLASENQTGWMKKVVQNVCRNYLRGRTRDVKLLMAWDELTEGQAPSTEDTTSGGTFEQCLTLLTEEEFQLVYERVVMEIPFEELAQKYGISVWACRKRVERNLNKLRKHFEEEEHACT